MVLQCAEGSRETPIYCHWKALRRPRGGTAAHRSGPCYLDFDAVIMRLCSPRRLFDQYSGSESCKAEQSCCARRLCVVREGRIEEM